MDDDDEGRPLNFPGGDPEAEHELAARTVTEAVAKLLARFPERLTPEAVFEGAVKGGAVALLSTGSTAENVADLLDGMARGFRDLDRPNLRVVQ